jgi:exopolysaccharide biosynthesis polyprenyl glycosylphosphotransferase
VIGDFAAVACGILAAYRLDAVWRGVGLQSTSHAVEFLTVAAAFLAVLLLEREGAYRGTASLLHMRQTERVLRISAMLLTICGLFARLFDPILPTRMFLLALLLVPACLMVEKYLFAGAVRILRRSDQASDRVVLYGVGDAARHIVSALLHSPGLGLCPVAVVDESPAMAGNCIFELSYRRKHSVPVCSGPINSSLLKSCSCQLLIVADQSLSAERVAAAEEAARHAGVAIAFLSRPELRNKSFSRHLDLDGFSILCPESSSQPWYYPVAKRGLDIAASLLLLTALAPFLLLIGLLVRFDSAGPALFMQRRVGRNGELFSMYKFRSMYEDAARYHRSPVSSRDARITRIGRLLRRLSLDELPQLLNVLRGDMSLVGPRPEMPFLVQEYSAEHRQRLRVAPGITGLWQLSADRAQPIHEALQYDLYYIRHRGFFMDIAILIHTLFFAIGGGI